MSLTQFSTHSLSANSSSASTCPLQPEDLLMVQSGRNDAQEDSNAQAKLDAMRHKIENRAENFLPGVLYAAFGDDENSRKPSVEESAPKSEEPGGLSSLIASISRWSIWDKFSFSLPGAKAQGQESDANEVNVTEILELSAGEPTESSIRKLTDYLNKFDAVIKWETVRDMVLTAVNVGCSKNSTVPDDKVRYNLATHLIHIYYPKMSEPSRLALFHYTITSGHHDIFEVLVSTHRAQVDHPVAETANIIDSLINRVQAHPEVFDKLGMASKFNEMFYDLMRAGIAEARNEAIPRNYFVMLDEDSFAKQITGCYDAIRSEKPGEETTPLEECLSTVRTAGYSRRPLRN
jgi:hypothetical protein